VRSQTSAGAALCGHRLPSLPRSKSPIRKEERLTIEANTGRPAQSELGIIVVVVTGNFLHEPHDLAPQGGIINSHERFDQP
jgi:hypothetical protein